MRILALIVCLSLAGCGGGTESTPAEEEEEQGVFDPLVENIDKARQVEDTVMEQKRQLDQAIDGADSTADESDDNASD